MTEKEKMLSGELYIATDISLTEERDRTAMLVKSFNDTLDTDMKKKAIITGKLFGEVGTNSIVKSPFVCDYGKNIKIGKDVFINYNCTILDCNIVEIGNNVLIGPNVQIYAATHPTDYQLRAQELEYAQPITIGDNVWIGGGAIIGPNVTIGKNTTIGAGSVVMRDVPENCVAVGNPCRVIKNL